MTEWFRTKAKQSTGKFRRFYYYHFRDEFLNQQLALRQGECNQCGSCCEIMFKCPFLLKDVDGISICSIYENRPGQCAAFPINDACLSEVNFDCTYSFGSAQPVLQIESAD